MMIKNKLYKAWFYLRRGHAYFAFWMSLMNFTVIQYELLIKKFGIFKNIMTFALTFVPAYLLIAITVGLMDRRKRVLRTEVEIMASENPYMMDVIRRLERIEKKINYLEKITRP